MKKISTILLIAAVLFTSCKDEPKIAYKYQQNDDLFNCSNADMDLIKEAVYAFEDYIENHYSFQPPNSIKKGYFFYWEVSKTERIPAVELINPHILEIRDELKKIDNLWIINNEEAQLNMKHPLVNCISEYMNNQELKKIFDVLIEYNTFKNSVFVAPLKRDVDAIYKDRALCTYLALNTFYARILNLDFSDIDKLVEINKRKYYEEQKKLFEANKKAMENRDGTPLKIDSTKLKN